MLGAKRVVLAASDPWGRVAFRAGKATALAGRPEEANPHPLGSARAKNWRDGWRTVAARPGRSQP